jgi:spoIIIJ-associated protein
VQWVETTGRTVEEALDAALDRLGVGEADAEWLVLEEPRPGLFGRLRVRLGCGCACVRRRLDPRSTAVIVDGSQDARAQARTPARQPEPRTATQ